MKLCVGVESVQHLVELRAARRELRRQANERENPVHVTRMFPRRAEQILQNGSLYWVIRGVICVRQNILALEQVTCEDGIKRCRMVFAHELVRTEGQPRRAFQGWRYLDAADAPADIDTDADRQGLPGDMQAKLRELGAW